jgi:hypothetical protein
MGRPRYRRPAVLWTVLCIGLAALVAGRRLFTTTAVGGSDRPGDGAEPVAVGSARELPLRIPALARPCLPLTQDEDDWVRRQIQPTGEPNKLTPSTFLHVLRAHGLGARFTDPAYSTSEALLGPLLDSATGERVFGKASLVLVPAGARYLTRTPPRESTWREYHRDQNLASFAELGLPLSTTLTIEGKPVTLRDVLRDSVGDFHLQPKELEWTALAYTLYLPPQAGWVNRYGERYTFDDLATELLSRRFMSASCGGAHLLYTLTMIARADEATPVLSPAVRGRIRGRLQRCAGLAVDVQKPDGSWPGDWFLGTELSEGYHDESPSGTLDHRRLVTGHMAEWMIYLPQELQVPETTLKRAGQWLLADLKRLSAEEKAAQFCPCTHAVCVLRKLSCGESTVGAGSGGHE